MNYLFEYDVTKSASNKLKHGIDFEQAKSIWQDSYALLTSTKQVEGEIRFIIVGSLYTKVWVVVFTYRNEKIRIISARRARSEEQERYEKH